MNQLKVSIQTLGCKVNHHESEKLSSDFRELGYQIVTANEPADICIINSCTVTSVADAKTRQKIRQARSKNQNAFVCVIGCMPEVAFDTVSEMKEVDLVIGNKNKEDTAHLISQRFPKQNQSTSQSGDTQNSRSRAFLKIEDGCDRYCAYCIIPYARGPVTSKPAGKVISDVRSCLDHGYREIVLSGINLALYGTDLNDTAGKPVTLYDLLLQLTTLENEQSYRIRLGSLEPTVLTPDEACAIASIPGICPQFHLSLQSGSNKTLKSMGRNYDTVIFLETIRSLRSIDPNFAITTDVIVGFPGETDADFEESLNFVRDACFSKTHVFPYSKREGTLAASMDGQVSDSVKKARTALMIEAGNAGAHKFFDSCLGKKRNTLIFGQDKQGLIRGLTDNGVDIRFAGTASGTPEDNSIIDLAVTLENISDL